MKQKLINEGIPIEESQPRVKVLMIQENFQAATGNEMRQNKINTICHELLIKRKVL